jgi:hypothetical protein
MDRLRRFALAMILPPDILYLEDLGGGKMSFSERKVAQVVLESDV